MLKIFSTTIILFLFSFASEATNSHALAKVKKGENIERLLKRFLLTPHNCNIESFCDLNNLKSKNKILAGKLYKLPLLIVSYNGKNIRSSAGVKDLNTAKKIEKLNADLLKAGIRDQNYKVSKKLWVPVSEFDCENDEEVTVELNTESNKIAPVTLNELGEKNKR
jgi:hypothetical protein